MRLLLLILLPLLLPACIRERIDIFVGGDYYNGKILSDPSTVEVRGASIRLKPGARLAIKTAFTTQWLGQYEVSIVDGTGLNAYVRTVSHTFDGESGVRFRWATDGCSVRSSTGRDVDLPVNAELDRQILSFYNEADLMTISIGCTKLYEEKSKLPATEYVILETLPNSTVDITSIAYFNTDAE